MEFKIPLRNKNGEIKAYAFVDKDDYEKTNAFKWHLSHGYAQSSVYLHRFIMNAKQGDMKIDHINGNKLDNRKNNLRFATDSQNAQNRPKQDEHTSKYKGVSYSKKDKKWKCVINRNTIFFDKEEHSAYWYDNLAIKYYGPEAKINGIKKPEDFIEPIKKENKILQKGIYLRNTRYIVRISNNGHQIYIGSFKTEEEAKKAYNKKKENLNKQVISKEVERNIDGIAIIKISNGKEILIDDDRYHELIKYTWHDSNNYAQAYIDFKMIWMHRYLLNAKEGDLIDHINNNRLDNRLSNLRISCPSLNSHNRTKKLGTTSKYYGVSLQYNKFIAKITKDRINYYIGRFNTQEEAAKEYDKKAIELYGNYAKLNFIDLEAI